MDCINNRIGIRGVAQTPAPQLYVNDLPGITFSNIGALANDDDDGIAVVWQKVKLAVDKKFEILMRAEFNKCCKISGSIVQCLVCHADNKAFFDVPLWYLHGVELMIFRTSTDAMNRYTTIDLDKAERLKEEYYAEFKGALEDAVNSINVSESSCIEDEDCIESNGAIRYVYGLP